MIQQQVVEVDDNDLNSFNSNVGEEMRRTCPCGMAGGASTVIKNQSKTSASHRKQLTYHSTLIWLGMIVINTLYVVQYIEWSKESIQWR